MQILLVLETTNTPQVALIEVVVACAVAGDHVPVVSVAAIVLTSTPPAAVVADGGETATGIAVATRQGGKAVIVRAFAIFIPQRRIRFQFGSSS